MFTRLLIANRGEVAVRIARAAAEMGIETVAVCPADDRDSRHAAVADAVADLPGAGVSAYLDKGALISAALQTGCDSVHPGYGFLSENAGFAEDCAAAGLVFIGPAPETLDLLGDKMRARALAQSLGIPVMEGSPGPVDLDQALAFLDNQPEGAAVMLKAVAGGGGRGIRIVRSAGELSEVFATCAAEAQSAFGNGALMVERMAEGARHVEVQILGDGQEVIHLWDRDCTLQRRQQKLIEIAPAPFLAPDLRARLLATAEAIGRAVAYRGLATVEFLIEPAAMRFSFMEVNPRLQVEHTVTEAVTGVDLLQAQIRIAAGMSLDAIGLGTGQRPAPRGHAVQLRINAETIRADGSVRPGSGRIERLDLPAGPGIRVDTAAFAGGMVNPRYDSLLAKLVAHSGSPDFGHALRRARVALEDFRLTGVDSNAALLGALLARPEVATYGVDTQFVARILADIATGEAVPEYPVASGFEGSVALRAPMAGLVVEIAAQPGERIAPRAVVAVVEAMKMQHVITAPEGGTVRAVLGRVGETVGENAPLVWIDPDGESPAAAEETVQVSTAIRPDLAACLADHALTLDAARPEAIARRHAAGKRSARENLADLCDPDSLLEYGALIFAAQRMRRPVEELKRTTPADGMVGGRALVNGDLFGPEAANCMVFAYDYTVMAGTQSLMNHKKLRRLLTVARDQRLPVIALAEGGGGRPGDVDDATRATGLDMTGFWQFAKLDGLVPRIAVVSGRCFAGNAVIAGCSDVLIATEDATIGMAGPVMIEGAGLGRVRPEEIGPVPIQAANGVIDIVVEDEAGAIAAARRVLGYFQGSLRDWECADQRHLRAAIPADRRRAYDMRDLIVLLADTASVTELRAGHAPGMVTALIRIEGRPLGVFANNPLFGAGAIDAEGAEKAAGFLGMCDRFGLPVLSLCDTSGFMVGPEAEKAGLVRRSAHLFTVAANLSVPLVALLVRRGYGLGAMAMTGGSFHAPVATAAWPTGEFGGMGIEGAVRLGYRAELDAAPDPEARRALFDRLVADAWQRGKATSVAASMELDAVIDPADSRRWILSSLPGTKSDNGRWDSQP
ncbi:acetyl-CoA carboxylase family protein [Paracoccus lichenicola]|uniref:acetyl-CoA carboxylase family protein n=1 Tax=Paracoccus lichenicola TaxID=2665644 RepID=UPI002E2485FA